MSEAQPAPTDDETTPDALSLSALLSSRVCHDLINPIGAIGSGLEVLDDPSVDDSMQDAAFDLIRSGAHKALALLKYARLAYGSAGGFGAQIKIEDATEALRGIFETTKSDLVWELSGDLAPKEQVKALLILGYAAADCVPRGGQVTISGAPDDFTIRAAGPRVIFHADLEKALGGDPRGIMPKFTPALIAAQILDESNGALDVVHNDACVEFKARFGATPVQSDPEF